jgi:hypothetical protein
LDISGYTTVKNSSLINCVICGVNAKRKFGNITEYKQHLAIFHFRNQVRRYKQIKIEAHYLQKFT